MDNISGYLKYPTGKIRKGDFCDHCGRYNNRYITTNVIIWYRNKVLLIKRNLDPGKDLWAIPGGYLDWDETALKSAKRELKEETGLNAGSLELVAVISDLSAGDDRQNLNLIFLTRSFTGVVRPELEEVQTVEWFSLKTLPDQMAFNHYQLLKQLESVLTGQQSEHSVLVI